jgi:hypothetical protein
MSPCRAVIWLALLTLLWPGRQLGLFLLRFQRLPAGGAAEGLVFAPTGALAGAALLVLAGRARGAGLRRESILGYLLAWSLAMIGPLLGGFVLPPAIGALLFGATPLIVGAAIGSALGRRLS